MNRDADDDLQALRQALPVPADRDFPAGRHHQREEHLMTSWLRLNHHAQPRPRRALRVALPLGLAAAAACTFLAVDGQQHSAPAPGSNQALAQAKAGGGGQSSLGTVSEVAYTITKQSNGDVKLVINNPQGKPNAQQMRVDLARLGVRAQVLVGTANCHDTRPSHASTPTAQATTRPEPGLGTVDFHTEHGKQVAYVHPAKIPAGQTLTLGFERPTTIWPLYVGVEAQPGLACIPAIPADANPGQTFTLPSAPQN